MTTETDITVTSYGDPATIYGVIGNTDKGRLWVMKNLGMGDNALSWETGETMVEHRYIEDIMGEIIVNDLTLDIRDESFDRDSA